MIYKKIMVIGLGTLGGFICNAIANLEMLESIVLIDDDIVETKNLKNSIYRQIDVDLSKTESLADIISYKNPNIEIVTINEKYIEGKTKIPTCDLVLDCRDFTYDRGTQVDARLYISSRYLMVDCRKNVTYRIKAEGKYLTEITKEDLRYAGSIVSMLIYNDTITALIKHQPVQKYELDHVKHIENNYCDILYEDPLNENKFIDLPDKIVPILQANKRNDLTIYVGSVSLPLSQFIVEKNSLACSNDLLLTLSKAITNYCEFNNFVVSFYKFDNRFLIELIPETGAA